MALLHMMLRVSCPGGGGSSKLSKPIREAAKSGGYLFGLEEEEEESQEDRVAPFRSLK